MNYLTKYANTLILNGYRIIPVLTGEKGTNIQKWTEKSFVSLNDIKKGVSDSEFKAHQGIGILCNENVIGIDIDVYCAGNKNMVEKHLWQFVAFSLQVLIPLV